MEIGRRPIVWWPVGLIAAAATLLLLTTAHRYDYHRDELYFRMLARDPQWGYLDQPPFTPMLARLGIEAFGDTDWAIRVPPAILLGLVAVLAAAVARELNGGAVAQSLAAAGVFGVFPLSAAHVTSTAVTDLLVWLGVLLCAIRALLWGRERAWLGAGLVAGLGLYNKHLVVLLLLCLAGGILIAGPRRVLTSRWLWAGAGLAVLVGLPNLIYQIVEGFPQVTMAAALADERGGDNRTLMLPLQFALMILPPVWIAGIVALVRDPRLRQIRALAVAYPLMLILLLVMAGAPYYSMGLLHALFAIGTVPTERWITGHIGRQAVLAAGTGLSIAIGVAGALPVIPADRLSATPVPALNQTVADQIGWREYVWQVAAVYTALPPAYRRRTILYAGNYGEAGALDRYGPRLRLPPVYSGHNELWRLGPPPEGRNVVIAVLQAPPARAIELFQSCRVAFQLSNAFGVENEETGTRVYVCETTESWASIWPRTRHYG
ncbi:glycosyltransferase family 39 protein [Actinoplanes sp. NBRC 101535]|uniref:glycosyltransferase family 39 protein n=1 Tax=Actinoplanes sp. NBRC 101535 TaxID=3032196 RepID=UPI0024A006FA|nr:glycosyltransferase family 39 protein [Actinoplanes sp. NBRC 101535]GLY05569.1 hypothetical protein Acsp01_59480 [Actinoplanes sp. NBRC 101535]